MLEETPVRLVTRAHWQDDAACRRRPLRLFFGTDKHPLMGANAAEGREVCAMCPVARDCLLEALTTNEVEGMRAGYLPHERAHTMERVGGQLLAAMIDYDAGVFYQPPPRRT
jgi:WhiB family transcriptional regulator, redox-sensing transcriptional regulator